MKSKSHDRESYLAKALLGENFTELKILRAVIK